MKEDLQTIPELRDLAKLQAQMLQPAQNMNMDGSFELGWGTAVLCFGFVPYFNAAAYDVTLINEGLKQTTGGRKRLRLVRSTLLLIFTGIPLLVCGLVFGLVYLSESVMRHAEIHWFDYYERTTSRYCRAGPADS